jgi:uncharacterized protein
MGPTLWVEGHPVPVLGAALLGTLVGYVAGMFGVGGGFLMTPLLVALFHVPLPTAVGTGLCQMIGTSLVSNLRHRQARQGEVRFDLLMLPGSLLGVELGARTLSGLAQAGSLTWRGHSVPAASLVVESCYAVMLSWVAWNYWRHGGGTVDRLRYLRSGPLARVRLPPTVALPRVSLPAVSAPLIAYIGLGLGFLSGLLGIGGGVALNPVLIYGFGFSIRQSVGTGISVLFVTAIVGTVMHTLRGHVHLGLALMLLVGGAISAQFGALASQRLTGSQLGRIHALVIGGAIVAIVWDLARRLG